MSQTAATVRNRRIDRRRSPKRSVKATCRKGTLDLGLNLALGVLDVAETGVRLLLKVQLSPNQEVTVTLEGLHYPRPVRLEGRVMWCVETADHQFCAGLHFDKRLPYADLQRMS
jgi:hypothetical protein